MLLMFSLIACNQTNDQEEIKLTTALDTTKETVIEQTTIQTEIQSTTAIQETKPTETEIEDKTIKDLNGTKWKISALIELDKNKKELIITLGELKKTLNEDLYNQILYSLEFREKDFTLYINNKPYFMTNYNQKMNEDQPIENVWEDADLGLFIFETQKDGTLRCILSDNQIILFEQVENLNESEKIIEPSLN
jgi:hypothetical protein